LAPGLIMKIFVRFGYLVLAAGMTLISACTELKAQTIIHIVNTDVKSAEFRKFYPQKKQADSVSAIRELNQMLAKLFDNGYLAASIDSLSGTKDSIYVLLEPGNRYKWAKLINGNVDEGILSEAGFREKFYNDVALKLTGIQKLNEKILDYSENHGYPFASIRYHDFVFKDDAVSAVIDLNLDRKITVDSIIIRGNAKLSRQYLYNYLAIKPGDLYNESLIRKIPNRIKELPMITEVRPFGVTFTGDFARIFLYIDDKKASQIDGVIGILPDANVSGKVQVTGDLRIRLLSSFGRGELFDLNWKQPQARTQDLKVKINYPFIFSTPFGADFNIGIYKKDTSYIEVNLSAGIQFLLKGGNYFKVFVNDKQSNLLSTKAYENVTVLPQFADVRVTSYGAGYRSEKLDYRLNPRSGYSMEISMSAGNKTIKKNGKLNPVVYDSLELKSVIYNGEGNFDFYFPLFRRNVINLGVRGAALSGESIFTNELYRFGGLRTLRGFDEESLLASAYVMGKFEFRYLLEQNSYLFTFINSAWYERRTRTDYLQDTPIGFGAGITFETKLGIFSFSYALGREQDNLIRFKAAKVHFGLINYF
jgi:outer membrane protein assembly factor BamA